ncbi:MAG: histidinol-phosphatase HisJ family protein [Candidatus Bathyarchaeota archaeon]|nr:histidinol-phosphatase HisJ family protein [Candidatus Bathyarchaeota archaeon]
MIDYHVHERHSRDAATARIPEYIASAEARGVHEIAFTTHFITIGPDVDISIREDEIPEYLEDIRSAQEHTKVHLLAGLEVDYFPGEERHLESILSSHDFDFILGSTHYINGVDIGSQTQAEGYFADRPIKKAADEYYTVWKKAIESGLFDVMAHPDYWRKYLHFYGKTAPWGDYGSTVYDALEAAADHDVGIEVNTAGERAGTGHFYPLQEFLVAAHEAGVKNVTVGSDSHTAGTLGYRLDEATRMLRDAGFTTMSTFKNRRSSQTPIEQMLKRTH